MKLYAKINSERGKTVNKGGNDCIQIKLYAGSTNNSVHLTNLTLEPHDTVADRYELKSIDPHTGHGRVLDTWDIQA
jgi:hypothetical protein